MTVTLRDVTRENYEKVGALQLLESQRKYLASNAFSLAQLHFYPDFRPRAIYSGEELVGFLMYAPLTEDGKPHDYKIFRFMIEVDVDRQAKAGRKQPAVRGAFALVDSGRSIDVV